MDGNMALHNFLQTIFVWVTEKGGRVELPVHRHHGLNPQWNNKEVIYELGVLQLVEISPKCQ